MTWTQPICERCWDERCPGRRPSRLAESARQPENCSTCGSPTASGIYVRRDPRLTPYPTGRRPRQWSLPERASPSRGPGFERDLEALVAMGFLADEVRERLGRAYDAEVESPVEHVVRGLVTRR